MNELYSDRTRISDAIRAASPRRTTPPGLEERIMAQVRLRERRRRERRAVAEMAVYCTGLSAVLAVVLYDGLMIVDIRAQWPAVLFLSAGVLGLALTAWSDRLAEVWRKL